MLIFPYFDTVKRSNKKKGFVPWTRTDHIIRSKGFFVYGSVLIHTLLKESPFRTQSFLPLPLPCRTPSTVCYFVQTGVHFLSPLLSVHLRRMHQHVGFLPGNADDHSETWCQPIVSSSHNGSLSNRHHKDYGLVGHSSYQRCVYVVT